MNRPWLWDWEVIGAIGAVGVLVLGAVAYLLASYKREAQKEWQVVAAARGEHIDDLEREIDALRNHFEAEISELRGQIVALRSFKAEEIAEAVATRLEGLWA